MKLLFVLLCSYLAFQLGFWLGEISVERLCTGEPMRDVAHSVCFMHPTRPDYADACAYDWEGGVPLWDDKGRHIGWSTM